MNNAQRLLTLCGITAGLLMILYAPFMVYGKTPGDKWITYAPIWELPYPSTVNPESPAPYCPHGHAFYLVLLIQLLLLFAGCSYIHLHLGKIEDIGDRYPEYYRP